MDIKKLFSTFYQLNCKAVFIFYGSSKIYLLLKQELIEIMDENGNISLSSKLPKKEIKTTIELEQIFEKYSIPMEEQKKIPVLNQQFQTKGYWNFQNALAKLHPNTAYSNMESSDRGSSNVILSRRDPKKNFGKESQKAPIKKSFSHYSKFLSHEINSNIQITLEKYNILKYSLETLPIPMLALDSNGGLLFANEDWLVLIDSLKKKIKPGDILEMIQDKVVETVMDGTSFLKPIFLNQLEEKSFMYFKPIQKNKEDIKIVGYLLWCIEKSKMTTKDMVEELFREFVQSNHHIKNVLGGFLDTIEQQTLQLALEKTKQKTKSASQLLGISDKSLYYRLSKLKSENKGIKKGVLK